jgi:hypothetical protein
MICPRCGKRERWWSRHYVHGILPGYVCKPKKEGDR